MGMGSDWGSSRSGRRTLRISQRVSQWALAPYVTDGRHRLLIVFSAYRRIRLLLRRTGVIHVVTAVTKTAEGEFTMTTTQEQATTASGVAQEPKAATKPNAEPRKPRVAPSKPRSRKKTTPARKASKAPKNATPAKAAGLLFRRP
jgi:hypothetical protein